MLPMELPGGWLAMKRIVWLMLASLIVAQTGCASHQEASADQPGWACRQLDGRNQVKRGPSQESEPVGVAAVLVVWPVLAGACWASRS